MSQSSKKLLPDDSLAQWVQFHNEPFHEDPLAMFASPRGVDSEVDITLIRNDICMEQENAFPPSQSSLNQKIIPLETEVAYDSVQVSLDVSAMSPITTPSGRVELLRNIVYKVMGRKVGDDDDIFNEGCDRLKATYIKNAVIRVVCQVHKGWTGHITEKFVYAAPSITMLSVQLQKIVEASFGDDGDAVVGLLDKMVAEFSTNFSAHRPALSLKPAGEVVLITGSTGSLGAQLLSHLTSSSDITHIYALNRRGEAGNTRKSLRERQVAALADRNLDVEIINSPKVTLVEGDTAVPDFGINTSLYDEIRDNVTLIIHNAWRVNFNLALESFKPMIRGVRNIVDFALQSPQKTPPRIIYTGSVAVFRNWDATQGRPLEAPIEDPKIVIGQGYGESKWVGERILEEAAKATPLRPIIVRIGQLTSNSSGVWKSDDWLPAIVRSGRVSGVLPARDDSIAWVSTEIAARAIVEFRTSNSQYLHLAHPHPVPWSAVFNVFSQALNVTLVSWTAWLSRLSKLEKRGGQPATNTALRLLAFYRGCTPMALENREATGIPFMDLTEALNSSPSLADPFMPRVGALDAERWLAYWTKNERFLDAKL